jgi:putative acetyltransferase
LQASAARREHPIVFYPDQVPERAGDWTRRIRCVQLRRMDVVIRPLDSAEDAVVFADLNREWISRLFTMEPEDRRQLEDPVAAYVEPGGEILVAELAGRPVGCVAIAPGQGGAYELSKMVVSSDLRGQGIGRRLLAAAVECARERGARSIFLGSSTKLADAVHLYEAAGFVHVSPDSLHMPYARADVFMHLQLA